MNWEDRISVKKGNIGEQIVKNVLEKQGYIVYKSITNNAHAFDFLAVKNKQIFLIAEVKSKARLNKYPATGINLKHYNEYLFIFENQKIDVILFFVDEHPQEERIYCGKLSVLMQKKNINGIIYPNFDICKDIVLFSLSDMIEVEKLTKEQLTELKQYNSRKYEYE